MPEADIYFGPNEDPFVPDSPPETTTEAETTEDSASSFERRIIAVQRRLKAPKSNFNSYGGFAYRNCEDILEALKPLLEEYDLLMTISDDIVYVEGRFYIKATVTVTDPVTGFSKTSTAFAREPENRKGSDQSQVTGSCSSYARKFALNALWLIDDNKDADEPIGRKEPQRQKEPPAHGQFEAMCTNCGTRYTFPDAAYYTTWVANNRCCDSPNWIVV